MIQRMVASKVRDLNVYRKGLLTNEIRQSTNKNPGLQKYIRYMYNYNKCIIDSLSSISYNLIQPKFELVATAYMYMHIFYSVSYG